MIKDTLEPRKLEKEQEVHDEATPARKMHPNNAMLS